MAEAKNEPVLKELADGVLTLTLNRPHRLNAWTSEMEDLYFDNLQEAAQDPAVRAIVVTGAGRGFCAGADMEELREITETGSLPGRGHRPQTLPLTVAKPIVAAVNGACAGIGLAQALMCDIRFAAAGAKFTTAFARRGLVAEHGTSWMLPRLVGTANALDLLVSGRVVLAEEAASMGLVNAVLEPGTLVEHAIGYARDLAKYCSPTSMAVMKAQVYRHLEADLATAVRESDRLMARSFTWPDMAEGVASYTDKRDPVFPPLGDVPGFE
ncbi:MAG TPA: enoyl-CoA hydratase-related protein [Acidimicrobiales bacterium]|nr:enoyl-CoA hydratase-related protein [Acidimicrobiales bacterium]